MWWLAYVYLGRGEISSNALIYLDDTLHVFYMSQDSQLVHISVVDGELAFQEELGKIEKPPVAVYDGYKLRVLAPYVGVYTRKRWGWAFVQWDIGMQADAWGNRMLYSNDYGLCALELSDDDSEVEKDTTLYHNRRSGSYWQGESETYSWPLAFISGSAVYTYTHALWHYSPYDDTWWYSVWCRFWAYGVDCPNSATRVSISPEHNAVVLDFGEDSYLFPMSWKIPGVRRPSLHYPYLLCLDESFSTLLLKEHQGDSTWKTLWEKELPEKGGRVSLWALDEKDFFALVQLRSGDLLLWGVGPGLGYRWRKGVLVLGGRGYLKFAFPDYPGSYLRAEVYAADGRLVVAGLVRDRERVPLEPGVYFVHVGGERLKAAVY